MQSKVSVRVGTAVLFQKERRKEVFDLLKKYSGTISEVAFFTSLTHAPLALSDIRRRAAILAKIIPDFKKLGLEVGINHLTTQGHHDENLDNSLQEPWQRVMDSNGKICRGCVCISDPNVQEYVKQTYKALAKAKPDFIWIDDDMRMGGHMPVSYVCFCKRCLADFSRINGKKWTRESLKKAFGSGTVDAQVRLRKQWMDNTRRKLSSLFTQIRAAVDSVDPDISLGFMTGELYYEGYAYEEWTKILSGPRNVPFKWRPGGGFYSDQVPTEMLQKAHDIGRQIARLPQSVVDIQSEIENFPWQILKKSVTTTALECAVDIGAGCTGAALNIGIGLQDPYGEYIPFFEKTKKYLKFFNKEVEAFGRSPCEGAWLGANNSYFATLSLDTDWFSMKSWGLDVILELAEMGLPMAYAKEGAAMTILSGDSCMAFSREELKRILSGGVLMDAPALKRLNEIGMSEYTGFDIASKRDDDTLEIMTADKLNDGFAGWHRDCRQSFKWWAETAYLLKPLTKKSRILTEAIDYVDKKLGVLSGAFENSLGGRIAVSGYFPWRFNQNLSKATQMKRICRWLSKDKMPAYVDSFAKVPLWCRRDSRGRLAMLLLNASLDGHENLRLMVRDEIKEMKLTRVDCHTEKVKCIGKDGPYSVLEIPHLAPWEVVLLTQQ